MWNKSFLNLLPLTIALFSSLGCSSSDSDGGSDSSGVSGSGGGSGGSGMTASEFGDRFCALFTPCCAEVGIQTDRQGCHALFGTLPPQDSDAAEACLATYEARAKEADWCQSFASMEAPESCAVAYPSSSDPNETVGTNAIGQACEFSDDCAPSNNGDVSCSYVGDAKLCQLRTHAAEGQPCSASTDNGSTYFTGNVEETEISVCDRQDGVYCDEGTCRKIGSLSEACNSDLGCVDGTYCDGTVCSAKVGAGSSCAPSSSACDDTSYCDFDSQKCLDKVPAGGACSDWGQCETGYCSVDEKCEEFSSGAGTVSLAMLCM